MRFHWIPYVALTLFLADEEVHAANASHAFKSASFGESTNVALATLRCPLETAARSHVMVNCRLDVFEDGSVRQKQSFCFSPDDRDIAFAATVERLIEAGHVEPATVDGVAVPVVFSVQIIAQAVGDGCHLRAAANLRAVSETGAADYVAPQRIRPHEDHNPRRLTQAPMHARGGTATANHVIVVSTAVAINGSAHDARVEDEITTDVTSFNSICTELQHAKYIPGFSSGQPSAMRYREWRYSRERTPGFDVY